MFLHQCGDCGERWYIGNPRTCKCPDETPQSTKQEPVAWLLTDKNINSLQVDSIQRLINRLNHAHHTDIRVRINGQDEWFEADWLKHMVRATPPQRKPLTDEQIFACENSVPDEVVSDRDWCIYFARAIEAKLKERNT